MLVERSGFGKGLVGDPLALCGHSKGNTQRKLNKSELHLLEQINSSPLKTQARVAKPHQGNPVPNQKGGWHRDPKTSMNSGDDWAKRSSVDPPRVAYK
jgi:hypothetical protein